MIVLTTLAAVAAECETASTRDDLEAELEAASDAFEAADLKAFENAVERARTALPCLEGVAAPSVAASMHRFEGLSAFVASDPDRAQGAFGAARRLEDTYRFPTALVPEGHPILEIYSAAERSSAVGEAAAPLSGTLRFDGRPTRERPLDHPTIFQWIEAGAVRSTRYIWPGEALPAYPIPKPKPTKRSARIPLLIGASAAIVAGGALFGAAAATNQKYYADGTTLDQIDGLKRTNNTLLIASGVVFTVGLGTGVTGLAVGR